MDNPKPDHDAPETTSSADDALKRATADDSGVSSENTGAAENTGTTEDISGAAGAPVADGAVVAGTAAPAASMVPSADSDVPADEWMVDGVPVYADGAPTSWAPGMLVALGLLIAALASVFFVFDADPTPDSTLVARVSQEPTPEPTAAPTAVPTEAPAATAVPTAAPQPTAVPAPVLIPELAGADGRFVTLTGLLGQFGLVSALNGDGPFTVFAPTDAAFDTVDPSRFGPDEIETILLHHVVEGAVPSEELPAGTVLTSLAGEPIEMGSNFAIVSTDASVVDPDLAADNGLIHAIDSVLIPPSLLLPSTVDELIQNKDNLTGAASFFETIGLRDNLQGDGPLTVFAPSDNAFSAADLSALRSGEEPAVGRYHVVEGFVPAASLAPGQTYMTLQGETLTIGDGLTINNLSPVEVDLQADNGLVHIIDGVLIPPSIATREELNALFALEPVQFAVSSAVILPESESTLDRAVDVLLANDVGDITIEGHTDGDGAADSNQQLSQARAESVLAYLVNGGVDAERLSAVGFGEDRLKVDPEVTPEDKAQNRRIEFALN